MKYSEWFGPKQKPGKNMVGVYQTKFTITNHTQKGYSWWNGARWGNQYGDIFSASESRHHIFVFVDAIQSKSWRGLVTKDGK